MIRAGNPRRAAILWTAAIALAGYITIWTTLKPVIFAKNKSDFSCFYRAGKMVLAGDASRVYDLAAAQRYDRRLGTGFIDKQGRSFSLPFVFPPYSLTLFAALACLPYRNAELAWFALNVGMLLALPFALRRRGEWQDNAVIAELLAPALFLPIVLALMQGQPSILLLLLFAMVFAALADGRDASAGMVLAFATLKPQLVLPMLLALVIWRKWRTLAAFVSTSLALVGVSIAVVGRSAVWDYPAALLRFNQLASSMGGEHPESMPNLRGCLAALFHARLGETGLTRVTAALSLLLLLAMAMLLRRRKTFSPASYSLAIVVTLLVSYHSYLHDDSLLLLPLLLMARRVCHSRWTANHVALAAAMTGLYIIPVLPTSLSATAIEMFAVMAMFSTVLALELRRESHRVKTVEPPFTALSAAAQ